MENNKSQFKRTGVLHDGAECIEIQISHSGDAARYVSTIKFTVRDPRGYERPLARDTLQQEKWLCVYCEIRQETIFAQISKNILTWQQETINLSTCYSTGFNAIAITILATAAEMLSIVFGPHDEQKQIDKMRELYGLLPVKPERLTREQIDEYAARMGVK